MVKALVIHKTGGPEVFSWEDVGVGDPGPNEVRVRHTAIGLNYIDIYHRTGVYPLDKMPGIIGMEAAGIVEAAGSAVADLKVGDRVAYATRPIGAYTEARVMDASRLVRLPDGISDRQAASMMLQGVTAEVLVRGAYPIKAGDVVLVHAAAGGVGLILCQWAKHLGATVIGTVGSPEKDAIARAHGCAHIILYRQEDFVARVKDITGGRGVAAVYDGVGKDTLMKSLDCLRTRGVLVSFGQASGKPDPLDIGVLGVKGSLFVTRPVMFDYTTTRSELLESTGALFDAVLSGAVKIETNQTYALKDAAQAHRDLASRKTTGSAILVP